MEAIVVEQLFQWYTQDKLTITQIVDCLNEAGDTMPSRGKRWHFSTVQRLLKQPAYMGKSYYNATQTCHGTEGQPRKYSRGVRQTPKHIARDRDEWIEISVPAILDETIWLQAQERLVMNQKFASRNNTQRFYLLRSLLVCGNCGRTLIARGHSNGQNGTITYSCTNRGKQRQPDVPVHRTHVIGKMIEPLVWQSISQLLHNPHLIADAWHHETDNNPQASHEVDRLQARLRSLQQQWTRLLDAFQDDLLDKDTLTQRKSALDQEQSLLQQRLQTLQRQQRQLEAKDQMIQDFDSFCQHILLSLDNITPTLQQEVIRLLVDHIVVYDDSIVIKHIIPTDDDCRLLPGHIPNPL